MHLVVHNHSCLLVVYRVDCLVIAIVLVAVLVLSLPSVSTVVEEERVIRTSITDQPPHSFKDVRVGRNTTRVLLIIRQRDSILFLESIVLHNERLDVLDIVDTSPELAILSEIVDADKESALATLTVRELEICGW